MGCEKYMQEYLGEGVMRKHPSFTTSKDFMLRVINYKHENWLDQLFRKLIKVIIMSE